MRGLFEKSLPSDPSLFNEFHALIVHIGKNICRPSARQSAPLAPCGPSCPARWRAPDEPRQHQTAPPLGSRRRRFSPCCLPLFSPWVRWTSHSNPAPGAKSLHSIALSSFITAAAADFWPDPHPQHRSPVDGAQQGSSWARVSKPRWSLAPWPFPCCRSSSCSSSAIPC